MTGFTGTFTLIMVGMPYSVSTSSMYSTRTARHMLNNLPTRGGTRGLSAGSRRGRQSASASAAATA